MDGEFPSGAGAMSGAPQEEDYTKMNLEDRLSSKVWKARVSGYEELIRLFEKSPSESAPVFKPYTRSPEAVKAIAVDSNAVAQEKGVEAIRAFLMYGGKAAGATREAVMPSIVEKCFGAMRAGTKKLALEVSLLYAEMEDVVGCEGIIQDLLKGTAAKQPKVIATSVVALTELVRDYGPKQASPKLIIKKLPDFFAHSDKTVRAEAVNLAKELHKWIGAALESTISTLKDIQAKELREQFAQLDAAGDRNTAPTRYLISQRPAPVDEAAAGAEQGQSGGGGDAAGPAGAEEVDPLEFIEPADPLKSKDWPEDFDEKIASAKWLDRKDVLAQCLKVLEATPKMIHSMTIDSIIDLLCEKIKKDSNINVALVACQCVARLATGLRSEFARNKDKALPALLDKLKEKKESTLKVVSDTLDAVFLTMSIGDILEQTLNATKHKNPAVKSGSIQFLARCLRETRQMPAKADVKPMADAFVVAIGDGSADVREAGAQGLGTLMKLIGERPMNQYIDGLDDIKKAKIQEQYKEATVKVKQSSASAGGSARPPPIVAAAPAVRPNAATPALRPSAPAPRKPAVVAAAAAEKENISPASIPAPSRPPVKKPLPNVPPARQPVASTSKPPTIRAGAGAGAGAAAASGSRSVKAASSTEPVKFKFHPEEADAKAAEVVPAHLIEEIGNSIWKERLAGIVKFNEWLKVEVEEIESELIVRFLSKKPGWKESNFQVMAEVYNSLRMLAQDCPSFARPSVALSVTPLCEKLGDIKLKGPAGDTLMLYAEKTSFGFVLMQALTPLGNIKAPKAIADSLLWVNEAILAFGTSGVDVKSVIEYLLTCLKSANAGVRTNATIVIGTLARFLGAALTTFLGDLNPQLRSTIEAEIDKAIKEPPPAPTRFSEEGRAKAETGTSNGAASHSTVDQDALDSLIPRVDLDQIMPSSAVSRMSDANWKERKESLEEVNAVLDANTRLKPNIGEVGVALKLRFSDSNIQVRTLALDAISKIATGMNKGFADHARAFVAPITQVMTDAKAPIRACAARALTAIVQQVGAGPMIPGFCSVLDSKVANPMLKQDLFAWLGEYFETHPPEKGMDLTGLALPAIVCLDDKLAAVRKAAQSVLPFIIMRAGYKYVMEQTNSLKTASRTTVIPLIDAAKAQAASKQPKMSASAAPVAAAAPPTRGPPAAAAASLRMPNIVRKGVPSSSDPPPSAPPRDALPDLPSATPRKGLIKPPSAVGRSLKPAGADAEEMRSATPRMSIVKRPTMGPAASSSPVAKSAPFLSGDFKFKAMREKKESGSRGVYWIGPEAAPRPELTEMLRQQCEHHLGISLIDTMFSKDHNAERDYLSALTLMVDYVSNPASALEDYGLEYDEAVARVMANSDLVFKYIALRLTDNNTSISLKCLDLTENLIGLLRGQEYHMGDYEANAIIPCLIAKFGDPKASFRDRIRQEIFRKLTFIYPPSKILTHYMEEGLPSKNARVRTECLAELGNLFSKNGPQVCSLPKVLPLIAQQISDRDNGVRTAALLAIGEVYKVVGEEETWRCVGKLPLKESGLLEERLRRTAGPAPAPMARAIPATASSKMPPPAEPRKSNGPAAAATQPALLSSPSQPRKLPIPTRLVRPASMAASGIQPPSAGKTSRLPGPVSSGIARPGTVRATGSVGAASATSSSSTQPTSVSDGNPNGHFLVKHAKAVEEEAVVDDRRDARSTLAEEDVAVEQAINEILSSDSNRSVMALKQIDAEIQNLAPALLRNADQLTVAFGKQLHRAFRLDHSGPGNDRLKKNLLFTGISMFDNTRLWEDHDTQRTLGSYVSKPALVSLLTELLQRLIETSGATDEETQAHGRYLNIIVLRTFSSCNLNVLFGACLAMLTEATEDLEELKNQGDEAMLQKRVRFSELIIKCLWKITRKLHASLQEEQIDATILLQDLERFMQAIAPNEWKRRASIGLPLGEMPLRTIKVIITHIGSCFGEEALDLLEGIPNAEESHVYKFLLRVCDRSGNNNGLGVEEEEDMATELPSAPTSPTIKQQQQQQQQRKRVTSAVPSSPSKDNIYRSPRIDIKDDAEAAVNAELRTIFDRIAQKAESRAAIKDLYLFQRRYPQKEANIQRSLESTGPIFQKFIKRALANHAAEDEQHVGTGDGGDRSPSIDSVMSLDRRDSAASFISPTSARSSTAAAVDWAATAASINRSSVMTPPSSRNSFNATSYQVGSSPSMNANSPNMQRNSATDERLAQLRAKFARSTSGASDTSVG